MIIKVGFSWAKVERASLTEEGFLRDFLGYTVKGMRGVTRTESLYFPKARIFPAGLANLVVASARERGYSVEVSRRSLSYTLDSNHDFSKLWPHQKAAILKALEKERGIIQHATGTGKGTIISCLCGILQGKILVVVTSVQLLKEMYDRIKKWTGQAPGRVGGGYRELSKRVAVCCVPSLSKLPKSLLESFTAIMADECFPSGTLVGNVPIEKVKVGDFVQSWNATTRTYEPRRVVRIFKSPVKALVQITTSDGRKVVATPGHPFMTKEGWIPAIALCGRSVLIPRKGSEERFVSSWARVDSVEVLEPRSDGSFGEVCKDGYVYNLEVEGTHTYTVNGIVVHNCHGGASNSYWRPLMRCTNAGIRIGFSGTPLNRSDKRSLHIVGLFGEIIHKYTPEQAANDKVTARAHLRIVKCKVPPLLAEKYAKEGDYAGWDRVALANNRTRNLKILDLIHKTEAPRIVFVRTLHHQEILSGQYGLHHGKAGVAHVNHTTEDEEVDRIKAGIENGAIQTLISGPIFKQGVDMRRIATVINAAGGKAVVDVIQKAGRGSRRIQDDGSHKESFMMVDFEDQGCGCEGKLHRSCEWLERHSRLRREAYERFGYKPQDFQA